MMLLVVSATASPLEKMRTALELSDLAVRVMRQNLRRRHPDDDPGEIEHRLRQWVRTRPGAEHGDCDGRVLHFDQLLSRFRN